MLKLAFVIFNYTTYCCSRCSRILFRDDEEESNEWFFCPYCGEPLYEPEVEENA